MDNSPNRANEKEMISAAGALIGITPDLATFRADVTSILSTNFYLTMAAMLEGGNWNFSMTCEKLTFNLRVNAWELPNGFIRGVALNGKEYADALRELNLEERGDYLFATGCCCDGNYCDTCMCLTYVSDRKNAVNFSENFKLALIYKTAASTAVLAGRSFAESVRLSQESVAFLNKAHNFNHRSKPAQKLKTGGYCDCSTRFGY